MRTAYTDDDLTFFLQVYRDLTRVEWCLTELRRHYPRSRVIVVSDGDGDLRFTALVARFQVELHYGERLYPLPNGGRMLERIFALWGMTTDYLFSIDPDTRICRRFRWLPDVPLAVFGDCWPTQGGCMGFTQQAGQKIFDSQILCDPLLTRPADSWAKLPDGRLMTDMLAAIAEDQLVRSDWIIFWACHHLGIPQIPFGEVYSRWREIVPDGLDRAVTHPHKELPIERPEL